jgi:hypothetical protein
MLKARVLLLAPLETIPAQAQGIVVRTSLAPDFYEVWFDGADAPCVVRTAELERISASGQEEAA